jgi:hypothetical protein
MPDVHTTIAAFRRDRIRRVRPTPISLSLGAVLMSTAGIGLR